MGRCFQPGERRDIDVLFPQPAVEKEAAAFCGSSLFVRHRRGLEKPQDHGLTFLR